MSPDGQILDGGPSAIVLGLPATAGFDRHAHEQHQLALAARGVLVMAVADVTWVLPRSRALWIPAGTSHAVTAEVDTTMVSLYLDPARCPRAPAVTSVVDATGLLGELIVHLGASALPAAARARAEAVLWDLMVPQRITDLALPLPRDDRARQVAMALQADPTDTRPLDAWGRAVGASSRTLARLFVAETGLTFARWRTSARLAAALPLLADGTGVGAVARKVGYANPSAFVAAFRRELGMTPSQYFRPRAREEGTRDG